jgi:hypothetical protein
MLSLPGDLQNRLDAGALLLSSTNHRNGRALPDGLYLFASEHTRALDSPKGSWAPQRRVLFEI